MKKVIRLTESELTRIVIRIIEEEKNPVASLDEQFGIIKSLSKSSTKPVTKSVTPLLSQLPHEVQLFIKQIPTSVKIGPKLELVFKNNYVSIKSLPTNVKRFGIDDLYARKLSDTISKSKGSTINLQEVYQDAHFLKKELENLKLNQSTYSVITGINRFISDLENILKSLKK
jgi:hypothetical protein